jgi:hypothetical protein
MDDGRLGPLPWLDRGPTGMASCTRSLDFHGPGRGAGNAINALVDAHRLTGQTRFLSKATELVHRCVHPDDDVAQQDLLNRDQSWSYTVFLNALSKYADHVRSCDPGDENAAYARDALLQYGRWMAEHEFPYLDQPEDLEFPTETWAAQDLRKSDALYLAAKHANDDERERMRSRAAFFHDSAFRQLAEFESRKRTRPLVIALVSGRVHGQVLLHGLPDRTKRQATAQSYPARRPFVNRKRRIVRKAIAMAALGAVVVIGAAVALLF